MSEDLTHDEILDATMEWINSADAMDRDLFFSVLAHWLNKHGSPPNSLDKPSGTRVIVAVAIRALPDLIRATKFIRADLPPAAVRRFMREATLSAFEGDLYEMCANDGRIRRRVVIFAQVTAFRVRQLVVELVERFKLQFHI